MTEPFPLTHSREIQFEHGKATGTSQRWHKGQYCSILTPAGIVGCGIYDVKVGAEFDMAIAIARGTPARPLVEPEDLLGAAIVEVTPRAAAYGIHPGMTGRQAVERMLQAVPHEPAAPARIPHEPAAPARIPHEPAAPARIPHEPAAPARDPWREEIASGIRVKTIDHVTLIVKDLERSRRFYVEELGMRPIPRPAFSFDGLWFQAGKTQIHLILEFARSAPAGNLVDPARRTGLCHHTAFEIDHPEEAVALLKKRNVPIVDGPKKRPDGFFQVFVADPDGHVIELCSSPKP